MSVVVGFVYFNLGLDQSSVRDRFGMMYIIGALYPYMVVLDLIGICKYILHETAFSIIHHVYNAESKKKRYLFEIQNYTEIIIIFHCNFRHNKYSVKTYIVNEGLQVLTILIVILIVLNYKSISNHM